MANAELQAALVTARAELSTARALGSEAQEKLRVQEQAAAVKLAASRAALADKDQQLRLLSSASDSQKVMDALREHVRELESDARVQRGVHEELAAKVQQMEVHLGARDRELAASAAELKTQTAALDFKVTLLDEAKSRLAELDASLAIKTGRVAEMEDKFRRLQTAKYLEEVRCSSLEDELAELRKPTVDQLLAAQGPLTDKQALSRLRDSMLQCGMLQSKIDSLEETCSKKDQDVDRQGKEIKSLQAQLQAAEETSYRERLASKNAQKALDELMFNITFRGLKAKS
jgi:hypothetical protein